MTDTATDLPPEPTTKALINELFEIRAAIDELEKGALKALKAQRADLESQLLERMETGEKIAHAGIGTVSVKEEVQAKVTDWDRVYQYVKENDAFFLLSRRVLGKPFRELIEVYGELPGAEPVTLRKLNVLRG